MKLKRWVAEFFQALVKENTPSQIAASTAMGMFLAFTPVATLHWVLALLLLPLFRFNLVMTVIAWAAFFPVGWFLSPVSNAIGRWLLLQNTGMHRLWAWLFHAPILPYTGFNNTIVLGSLVISAVLILPVFILTKKIAIKHGGNISLKLRYSRFWNTWSRYRVMAPAPAAPEKTIFRFRWKGIFPVIGVLVLGTLYMNFLFDRHLCSLLSTWATNINRAPVEIESVKTHLLKGEIELNGVGLATVGDPKSNLFEIDKVTTKFLVNPLLRKKLIVEKMLVSGVHYDTLKKKQTDVSLEPETFVSSPGLIERVASGIYDDVRQQLGDNPLRNIGILMTGMDLSSKVEANIKQMESSKKAAELQVHLKSLAEHWNKDLATLPVTRTLAETKAELLELSSQNKGKPDADTLEKINRIHQSVQSEQARSNLVMQKISSDFESVRKEVEGMSALVDRDVSRMKDKLNLPRLDFKDLTPGLLGPVFLTQLERLTYWVDLARRRMPKGSRQGQITTVAQVGSSGINVNFGKMSAFPAFLLVDGLIESDPSLGRNAGKVKGSIHALTSDPPILGEPTRFNLSVDFPESKVTGLHLEGTIDHLGENATETIRISADNVPVDGFAINDSGDLKLGVSKGFASFSTEAVFDENDLKAELFANFRNVQFVSSSRFKRIEEKVKEILSPVTTFSLTAKVSGNMDSLKYNLSSTLGTKLAEGIFAEFKHQILAIEDDIRKNILDHVHPEMELVKSQLNELRSNVLIPAQHRIDALEELVNSSDKLQKGSVAAATSVSLKAPKRAPASRNKSK